MNTSVKATAETDGPGGPHLLELATEAERLLKSAANAGDAQLGQLADRLEAQVRRLRTQIGDAERAALASAREAARQTDQVVRGHPYGAMGIAAAAGLLIGFLVARR